MKNQFSGVLRENKTGVEMGEKKNIKQSHCRVSGCGSHSGIFNACSCETRKTSFYKQQQQLRGRSRVTAFGDDGLRVITALFCPPCGESTAKGGVLNKDTSFYNLSTALQATSPTRGADKSGFTLIELLVVVLIIGILAAVVLPQYQKAVEKSKAAQAFSLLRTSYQATESFFLSNGVWPQKVEDLDIDISWQQTTNPVPSIGDYARSNGDWALEMANGSAYQGVLITRIDGKYKGGSFGIFHTLYGDAKAEHVQEMICMEQLQGDYAFGEQEGEYCTKLFHGTKFNRGSGQRFYYF